MKAKFKILLAEDDPNLGALLCDFLVGEGFDVKLCKDGMEASQTILKSTFDLFLLDVMMPKKDGFTLAKEIRDTRSKTPILFITAKSLKEDKLIGYDLGADDYITKPFDEEELLWKIKAIFRRIGNAENPDQKREVMNIGEYLFDPVNQSLTYRGTFKRITEKESHLLSYLYEHRNRLIKREELLTNLWGENDYFLGRSLDVFITKMRKYLKEDESIHIENVFGVGFIFNVSSK
jgi:DNA-binding response OmpR family regulator